MKVRRETYMIMLADDGRFQEAVPTMRNVLVINIQIRYCQSGYY